MSTFAPKAPVVYAPHLLMQSTSTEPAVHNLHDRPLKVVVLGGLSKIKGADTLEAVASLARLKQAPIEFHLLGYGYRSLKTQPRANLTVHGAYQDQDLPDLLKWLNADLAWFPAQCPETYSYTLSACLSTGLPVMASDLGAFSERLQGRPWSWIVDWESTPTMWFEQLLQAREQLINSCPPKEHVHCSNELPQQWGYKTSYLATLKQPSSAVEPAEILSHLHEVILSPEQADKKCHTYFLSVLYWLRGQRLLAPITKMIPSHLQRRVKNGLLG